MAPSDVQMTRMLLFFVSFIGLLHISFGLSNSTENCTGVAMDLVFVVDASTSIKPNNFRLVRSFLADVVGELDISQSLVRVAVVRFSDDVQILLYLNQSTSRQHVQKLIMNMHYQQGGTNTYTALQKVRESVLLAANGNREAVQDVVMVITDGVSWKPSKTVEQARLLRETGAYILALGILGADLRDHSELKGMSSFQPQLISDFASLKRAVTEARGHLCWAGKNSPKSTSLPSMTSPSTKPSNVMFSSSILITTTVKSTAPRILIDSTSADFILKSSLNTCSSCSSLDQLNWIHTSDKTQTASHEEKIQATSHEEKTQATSHEDMAQAITHEDTTQGTSHEDTTQATIHEDSTQATSHLDATRTTSHEDTTQATSQEDTTQASSHEDTTKATSHEDMTQATGQEDKTRTASQEDKAQGTNQEDMSLITRWKEIAHNSTQSDITQTSHEDTTQSTSQEDTTQATSHEDTTQATSHEDSTQDTSHLDTTQTTSHEDTTQTTSHEDTTQATSHEDTTQATSHEDTSQATGQEDKTRTASQEDKAQDRNQEDMSHITRWKEMTHNSTQSDITQTTSQEDKTLARIYEDKTQTISQEDKSQATIYEDKTQITSQEDKSQATIYEDKTQITSQEDKIHITNRKEMTHNSSQNDVTQTTSPEDTTQSTSQEDLSHITSRKEITHNSIQSDVTQTTRLGDLTQSLSQEMTQNSNQRDVTQTAKDVLSEIREHHTSCDTQELDLVFVLDSSCSVSPENFERSKAFIANIVSDLQIGNESVRVGLVRYGSSAEVVAFLNQSRDVNAVKNAIASMSYNCGSTNTSGALKTVREQVLVDASRDDVGKVTVVITDGESNSFKDTKSEASNLRNSGVRLVWLYIFLLNSRLMERERTEMIRQHDVAISVNNFDELGEDVVRKVVNESCRAFPTTTQILASTTTSTVTRTSTQSTAPATIMTTIKEIENINEITTSPSSALTLLQTTVAPKANMTDEVTTHDARDSRPAFSPPLNSSSPKADMTHHPTEHSLEVPRSSAAILPALSSALPDLTMDQSVQESSEASEDADVGATSVTAVTSMTRSYSSVIYSTSHLSAEGTLSQSEIRDIPKVSKTPARALRPTADLTSLALTTPLQHPQDVSEAKSLILAFTDTTQPSSLSTNVSYQRTPYPEPSMTDDGYWLNDWSTFAGITVGGISLIALTTGSILFLLKRRRNEQKKKKAKTTLPEI